MKHESIVVVYDSCQAIAEEIADKLGAEAVSAQSMNVRQIESCQSFILAFEYQSEGMLTPHWQYVCQTICSEKLYGKSFAVFVALGDEFGNKVTTKKLCYLLREKGAHIVGEQPYVSSRGWNLDNWVSSISPNL